MTDAEAILETARNGLVYLPIGGAGEIGMNFYLYGCQGKWIAVECGITFGDTTTPGIDVMMADPAFLKSIGDDLIGLVLTHAHEDHQGATGHLWPRLNCPVYATAFTAGVVRTKLAERGLEGKVPLHVIEPKSSLQLGPFDIRLVTVTHSIPEPNALAIGTPFGRVIHTGDWKLDPRPLVGEVTEEATFRRFGDEGVLALVCDSTNVFNEGESGSESRVREVMMERLGGCPGRIAVTCFASNIARIESVAAAAAANGREVALVGRSLWKLTEIARDCGMLADTPRFLTEYDAGFVPPERLCIICTGSQGERGSALERISRNDHPRVVLEKGDTVFFSSRQIPGNERGIYAMQDRLARLGVKIVTEKDAFIHVSGHPARDELARLYSWVRPRIAVPMHGESRHLIEHQAYALELGVPESFVVTNGHALRLGPEPAEVVGEVAHGRLGIDGDRLVTMSEGTLRDRRAMNFSGMASVSVVLDQAGRLAADPKIGLKGVVEEPAIADLSRSAEKEIRNLLAKEKIGKLDDDEIREKLRLAVRRAIARKTGKRPVAEVHLFRL